MYGKRADNPSNNLRLNEISLLIFFPILLQKNQKLERNSCRRKLLSTPRLILLNIDFKILRRRPDDEAPRVSFKLLRRR